jgi:hypothetical protein
MDHVALVYQRESDPSRQRRCNAAVGQLELGVVDLGLVALDDPPVLINRSRRGVELLPRDGRDGFLGTLELELRVLQQRLVPGELTFCLAQLDLERARVDLREQLTFVDELTVGEVDLVELTVHAGADRDRVVRGDGAEAGEINRHVAPRRRRREHRHGGLARALPRRGV